MNTYYRPDIDGLRAVAVLSVVLFHAGIVSFSGGYVGVDVFFVISGYLITSIIVREIGKGSFSITRFYSRRFRRILPALTAVILFCLAVGAIGLGPSNFIDLAKSAAATAVFSSNFFFYSEAGYFDGPAESKPLLHTWSLAVEEQYYIFFPLLLILIAKYHSKKYAPWLLVISFLSLTASIFGTHISENAAFYLIHSRAWELLTGSLLAIPLLPVLTNPAQREIISGLGLVAILISIFTFNTDTVFPGYAAILPVLGSAMIIYAGIGGKSLTTKLLSYRPFVFIGLISYSLYLWHWPIIVFFKYYVIIELSTLQTASTLGLSILLATLSWKFIEQPFRTRVPKLTNPKVLWVSAATLGTIFSCALFIIHKNGLPDRFDEAIISASEPGQSKWLNCRSLDIAAMKSKELCNIGAEGKPISFIFWGDSHAEALAAGIDESAKNSDVRGKIATKPGCAPLLSVEPIGQKTCSKFNQKIANYVTQTPAIETVILAARWALITNGARYKSEHGDSMKLFDNLSPKNQDKNNEQLLSIGITRLIDLLQSHGKKVILVEQVPEVGYEVPSAYFVSTITNRDVKAIIAPTRKEFEERTQAARSLFAKLEKKLVQIVDPAQSLCDKETCTIIVNKQPIYFDDDHLSEFGSKYISKAFDPIFSKQQLNTQ